MDCAFIDSNGRNKRAWKNLNGFIIAFDVIDVGTQARLINLLTSPIRTNEN
jgi:hypothetical protein